MMVWLSLIPPLPLLGLAWAIDGRTALLTAIANTGWLGVGAVLYIAVLSTLVGFGIWGSLLKRYPRARLAPFSLLVPLFGAASAALVYGETFGPGRLAGMALILAGLGVVALPYKPGEGSALDPPKAVGLWKPWISKAMQPT